MKDRAWLELSRPALAHNVACLRERLPRGCELMAVVKGNAYGHGLPGMALELRRLGVDSFCVATAEEGAQLRRQGVRGTILVLGYTNPSQFWMLEAAGLTQTVVDRDHAAALSAWGRPLSVHIKLDTGMHRLGLSWEDEEDLEKIFRCSNLQIAGLFTHLCADDVQGPEAEDFSREQIRRFYHTVGFLEAKGIPAPPLHIQSSYGIFRHQDLRCQYARAGIALYGMLSTGEDTAAYAPALVPVLSARARVESLHTLRPGEHAGYGLAFTASRQTCLAAVSLGYADGVPRELSQGRGEMLLHGVRCPIAGTVCMDQLLLDVTGVPSVRPGDVVTFLGRDGGETITVCEVASRCGTIANEVLARLGSRFERLWTGERTCEAETLSYQGREVG